MSSDYSLDASIIADERVNPAPVGAQLPGPMRIDAEPSAPGSLGRVNTVDAAGEVLSPQVSRWGAEAVPLSSNATEALSDSPRVSGWGTESAPPLSNAISPQMPGWVADPGPASSQVVREHSPAESGWEADPVPPGSNSPYSGPQHTAQQPLLDAGIRAPPYATPFGSEQHSYNDDGHETMATRRFSPRPHHVPRNMGAVHDYVSGGLSADERFRYLWMGPPRRYQQASYSAADPLASSLGLPTHDASSVDFLRAPWSSAAATSLSIDSYKPFNLTRIPGPGPEQPAHTTTFNSSHDPYLCVDSCCSSVLRSGLTFYRVFSNGLALRVLAHMGTRGNFISAFAAGVVGAVNSVPYPPWVKIPETTYITLGDADWTMHVSAHVSAALPPGCDVILGLDWLRASKAVPDWTNRTLRFQTSGQGISHRSLPEWN